MALPLIMSRWIGFIAVILIGIGLGLFYGLMVDPVEFVDTTPESLRDDYRADYVLMVAEVYQAERDVTAAITRLAFLVDQEPLAAIQQTSEFGAEMGYTDADMEKIEALLDAVVAWYENPAGDVTP